MTKLSELLVSEDPLREYLAVELGEVDPVRVRSLTELERSQNEQFILDDKGGIDPRRSELQTAHLMWLSLVDENGDQCYSMEQIPNLANLPEKISLPILKAITSLRNGHASKKNGSMKTSTD